MSAIKDIAIKDKTLAFRYFVSKAEKLTTATYILTESLKDAEPLKWRLRDRSLSLLSDLMARQFSAVINRTVFEILSLIDLALAGRLVSEANFNILRREYSALREGLVAGDYQTEDLDFSAPLPEKTIRSPQPAPSLLASRPFLASTENAPTRPDRVKLITEVIRGKGSAPIKDIAQALPALSSKTVQRELNRLVEKGIVKREGERRWSRYQLAP